MGIIKLKNANDEQAVGNVAMEEQQSYKLAVEAQVGVELPQEEQEQWDDPAVLHEDETRTDENSRHYVLNNGTAKSVFNAEPVSFFDEEEKKWKYIDNSLEEKEDTFESKSGKFKTRISKVHKGKKVAISKSDKQLSWEYLGKQVATVANENVDDVAETVLKVNNGTQVVAKHINSSAVYENIEKDTDLEYCLLGNNLKENIIVKEKSTDYRYLFTLKTEGLKLRLSDDNESLELYTEKEKEDGTVEQKVEFTIPSPYMYDANGVASDDVYYELEPSEDGKFAFAVVANEEWVNATDRAFPVTIDPQVVTSQNNLVTKQTYYRDIYSSYGSGSGSGISYSSWYTSSIANIKVSRSNYNEYRTTLTVKRNLFDLITDNIVSVKLVLTPSKSFSGYLYCNGVWTYYNTANGNLKIDITNSFKNNLNSFSVTLEPYTYTDMQFYMSGEAPKIEIQTLTDENVLPLKKTYSLAGTVNGELNFSTGEIVNSYTDVPSRNILLGLPIAHIYKKHSSDFYVGKNFRLNLHEQFKNNDGTYEYTDAMGNVYGFKEYHYCFDDNGNKNYILASKDEITIETDGRLTYNGKEVFLEYKSLTGLKAITNIEDYIHSEYFENRGDEEKQYGEQCENYKVSLSNYVAVSYDGSYKVYLSDHISTNKEFQQFLNDTKYYYLMTKAEKDTYEILNEQYNNTTDSSGKKIISIQMSDIRSKSADYIAQIKRTYKEYVNIKEKFNQCQLQTPINFLTNEKIIKGYNKYGQLVNIYDRYGNYVVIEYERYDVNNIDKARIKQIYDNQKNLIVFSYNFNEKLSSILDVNGRKINYVYNDDGWLLEIKDDNGIQLVFGYDSNGNINLITEKKKQLRSTLSQTSNTLSIVNESLVDTVKPDEMIVAGVADSGPLSKYDFEFTRNSYQEMDNVLVTSKTGREKYIFNLNKSLSACYIEENGVVVKAEQYEYQSYWNGNMPQDNPRSVTKKAAVSSLCKVGIESYTFVVGDTETTIIDQFNNSVSKTTSEILISEWLDASGVEQQNRQTTAVSYTYDDNQKLVQETIVVSDSNPAKTVTSYKKYNYNAYGDVIRTESYVEGEEYTTGKTIEETVYDDKGNVIKSFTYNSLDTSSKFYTETEYDENGKVTAELDETGENKTKFGYVDGTSTVREEVLPNGSKFAYGRDYDDTVTAISQSTAEGEENSTQKVYRYGAVVELKSGNNNVKYAYNHKRKLKAVELNGVEEYVKYDYTETQDSYGAIAKETVTATYKAGDVFVSEKDGKGNLLKLTANNVVQIENVYDKKGQLNTLKDKVSGKNYKFERDELDNVTAVYEVDGSDVQISSGYGESVVYDALGSVKKKTIVGPVSQVYDYTYKTNSLHTLENIAIGSVSIKPETDVQGRNKGKSLYINSVKVGEENISYRKVSDHATNMPSTVWFGDKTNGTYQIKDSVRYAYDKMGNIEKVYENGELAIHYQYDALNRLVREDNKTLDKTYVFVYDNNGNIVKRREFVFTLKDNTLIEELESTDKVYIYNGDQMVSYNGQTCVYDVMGNPTTYRGKTATWVNGRRLASFDGHTFTYDGQGRRLTKDSVAFAYDSNGRLIKQGDNMEFFYDQTGVVGLKYGTATYLYRKDAQNNIIALIGENGAIVARYLYDAWGNVSVVDNSGALISDVNHIGNLNPFRYRGYYYDTETKLYFLKTRYYDPEIGRFMTIDGIEYLDPETINGLNLYAYCGNNPVSNVDPNGNAWWHWLAGALAVVGVALVVAAITVLTAGVGTTVMVGTLAGAVIHGAAVGTLIGAGVGVVAGGIIGGAVSGWTVEGIFTGIGIGLGVGAIAGAIIGGTVGANGWYNAKALEFTHNAGASKVVLGRSGVYENVAIKEGATYFKMPDAQWDILSKNSKTVWRINKAFLKQQISAGKNFIMSNNPSTAGGYYFQKEVAYLIKKGIQFLIM